MKRKILIHVCALILLLTSSVYAQEVPTDIVVPDPNVVIPIPDVVIPDSFRDLVISTPPEVVEPEIKPIEFMTESTPVVEESPTTTTEVEIIATSTVHLFIRNGADLIFEGNIPIIEGELIKVKDTEGVEHEISSESPLAVLITADTLSDDFNIPALSYYSSMGLLLDCLEIKGEMTCYDFDKSIGWNYAINGNYPAISIDLSRIKDTNRVGLMFGKTYQVISETDIQTINKPFNIYTQKYNYGNNTWESYTGDVLGLLINPWDISTILATSSVDAYGKTSFSVATSGNYSVGIYRNDPIWGDYYDSISSIFIASSTVATTTSGSTGGGSNKKEFDFDKALKFIGQDNSYGSSGLSSWVAIAFSSYGKEDSSLRNYIKSTTRLDNDLLSNERQAMAILALGENPYNFKGINFVEAIIKKFDGTQFGELSQINDDIFALIVLSKVGYTLEDIEIQKTVKFLKTKQGNDGIWDNNDLTGAAIQALRPFVGDKDVSILSAKKQLQKNSWWESVSSTSWVAMAMYDLGENWTKGGKTAKDYFSDLKQQDNGSLTEGGNDLMTTAYAIPAILGKSWNDILNSVSRPVQTTKGVSGGASADTVATSTASTTVEIIPLVEEVVEEVATSTIAAVTLDFTEDSLDTIEDTKNSSDEVNSTSSIQATDVKQDQEQTNAWSFWFKKMSGYISGIFGWLFS